MLRLRRKSRTDQVVEEVKKIPAAVLIGAGAALSASLIALGAYFGRHRLWGVVAKVADAVEEVADTVEDAAEDLAEAAQARAAGDSAD